MTEEERHFYEHILYGRRKPEPPRGRGPQHAVRPPWAPPDPPPLVQYPALLPGLVDLAEQAEMVFRVARCPECGVFFEPWVAVTDDQFARGELSILGCACELPRVYEKQTARRLVFYNE